TAVEAVHLLGVAEGRLLFTTATRYRRGIRALDAVTGNDVWVHEEGDLPSSGRGLIAEGRGGDEKWVYWPVGPLGGGDRPEYRLYALDARDGHRDLDYLGAAAPLGNLAYANGCLVMAGTEEIKAYVSDARFLDKRRQEAQANRVAPLPRYRLALAEIAAG